jgi:histone H3/H4
MPAFCHQGGTSGRRKADDCRKKVSLLAPRNGGSKGDSKFQKNTELLIRNATFQHLVRGILQANFKNSDMQMQSTALLALQEATEYFMVDVFSDTNLCAKHGNQVTIKSKDLALACCI